MALAADDNILHHPDDEILAIQEAFKSNFHTQIRSETYCCFSLRFASMFIFLIHWIISLSVLIYVMFLCIRASSPLDYIFAILFYFVYTLVVTGGFYGILNGEAGCVMLYFVFFLSTAFFYFIFALHTFATIGEIALIMTMTWFCIVTFSILIIWRVYVIIEKSEMQIFLSPV